MADHDSAAPRDLDQATEQFVTAWGALSHAWGISRTMSQVHALLFVSPEPLCTDDIMESLSISRGSANMNLRSLEEWRLVRRVHKPGDRKDYYQAEGDAWRICWTLVDERKRREVDPLLAVLRDALAHAPAGDDEAARLYRERLGALLEIFELLDLVYERLRELGPEDAGELLRQMAALVGNKPRPPRDEGE